jgi:hypothetical protein
MKICSLRLSKLLSGFVQVSQSPLEVKKVVVRVNSEIEPQLKTHFQCPPVLHSYKSTRHTSSIEADLWFISAGSDYFRLSWNPEVRAAAIDAIERFGLNVAASRRTTGNHPLYELLEGELADYFEVESSVLLASGYAAPAAALQGLARKKSLAPLLRTAHIDAFGTPSRNRIFQQASSVSKTLLRLAESLARSARGVKLWSLQKASRRSMELLHLSES